jgi:hypothetical protein
MLAPVPVNRLLVPDVSTAVPGRFTAITESIVNGLPHVIRLADGLSLAVVVPTGLATRWRDLDPTVVVSSSEPEVRPVAPSATEGHPRSPARLLLRSGTTVLSSIPLAAGLRRTIPEGGDGIAGVRLSLVVLSWDIRAGSLRGAGDFGSRIALATAPADRASDTYETPRINPELSARLSAAFRTESQLGLATAVELPRFARKRVVLR